MRARTCCFWVVRPEATRGRSVPLQLAGDPLTIALDKETFCKMIRGYLTVLSRLEGQERNLPELVRMCSSVQDVAERDKEKNMFPSFQSKPPRPRPRIFVSAS